MNRRVATSLLALVLVGCSNTAVVPVPTDTASSGQESPFSTIGALKTLEPTAAAQPTPQDGGSGWQATAASHAAQVGARFVYHCPPGGVIWSVYGTDIYTHDSSVCTAAVHYGVITVEGGGDVVIRMNAGRDEYFGSTRNGITSQSYATWPASFAFDGAVAAVPNGTPTSSSTTDPAPTNVVESEFLTTDGLIICLPFERSRFAEYDASGTAIGVDVEIGQQIAAKMGREPELVETLFDELINEIVARACDLTIGGQFITQERLELIDMIPYRQGTPHVVVRQGNPLGIDELTDLCGRSFAVVAGTVYVDIVHGRGDYAGQGLDAACADAGAAAIDLQEFDSQAEAEQALAESTVDAYAGNDFVTIDQPDVYDLAVALPLVRNGIGHFRGANTVDDEVRSALRAIIDDGTYADILSRYGVSDIALTDRP